MITSPSGIRLIQSFEGLKLQAYLDGGGVPTIGYGTIIYPTGKRVKMGDICTLVEANQYLQFKIAEFEKAINKLVTVTISQNQFDALVSFVYNIGITQFNTSTLLKKLNENNFHAASEQFPRWNKDNGKVIAGLTKRRNQERALFERQ